MLSLYTSPHLPTRLQKKVLHLLFQTSQVGGSTTLLTRAGLLSWIEVRLAVNDGNDVILRGLAERLYETCEQEKVNAWSGTGVSKRIAGIGSA